MRSDVFRKISVSSHMQKRDDDKDYFQISLPFFAKFDLNTSPWWKMLIFEDNCFMIINKHPINSNPINSCYSAFQYEFFSFAKTYYFNSLYVYSTVFHVLKK